MKYIFKQKKEFTIQKKVISIIAILASVFTIGLLIPKDGQIKTEDSLLKNLSNRNNIFSTLTENPPFANIGQYQELLFLPAKESNLIGIGYHQAENRKALEMIPKDSFKAIRVDDPSKFNPNKRSVIMAPRGRGSPICSAADIAVKRDSIIYAPVSGKIVKIKEYSLYGKYLDYHIEIRPNKLSNIRVAIIHIKDLKIEVGQEVNKGITELGKVRSLSKYMHTQISDYYGPNVEHIHIQINPAEEPEEKIRS